MTDDDNAAHRQQELYLSEVLQLIAEREYMRRYRVILAKRVTWFGAVRAIASSGAIATWAVWKSYPMVWGGVIAATQVADALKGIFPFTARHKAANDLVASLEALLIEVLHEAEAVHAGELTDTEIRERRRRMMKTRHEASLKYFPTADLPERKDINALAQEAAVMYYDSIFKPRVKA
jgi:hypothetical protein